MLIKILLIVFILFAFSRVVLQFRKKQVTMREFLFWSLFWAATAIVVAYPNLASRIALLIGVGRGADVALYGATLLLFYLVFRIFVRLERIDQHVTTLTTTLALRDDDRAKKQ